MILRVSWEHSKAELSYPIGRAPRTAVLVPWFRASGEVRVFRRGWTVDAAAFAPQSIVATWSQLEALIAQDIVSPERSLIVVSNLGDPLLTADQRDRLWRAFHVPVFEQIVGRNGELYAAECEAHDGMHLEDSEASLENYAVERIPCACGRKSPRIVPAKPVELARAAAAFAR